MNDRLRQFFNHQFVVIVKTLVIALIGVLLALWLSLPLPWLMGPLLLLTALSMMQYRFAFITSWNNPVFGLLGIYLGSTLIHNFQFEFNWLATGLLLIIFSFIATLISFWYLYRVAKFSKQQAGLASLPGVLAFIVNYAIEKNIPIQQITVVQTIRVLLVIAIAPFLYTVLTGNMSNEINSPIWTQFTWSWVIDLGMLALVAYPTIWLYNKLNIPNPHFLGGMSSALAMYYFGFAQSVIPTWILQFLLVLIGIMIGIRFNNTKVSQLLQYGFHGVVSTVILLLLTAGFVVIGSYWLDKDMISMFLAFAPGGIHEMVVIAMAYGVEPLFVTTHHLLRVVLVSFLIPLLGNFKDTDNNA